MPVKIITTPAFRSWKATLSAKDELALLQRLELLRIEGPHATRPYFDTLKGSRYPNLREIVVTKPALRALYIFDPRQNAVLLLGGDKSTDYQGWYHRQIPLAEAIYENYLRAEDRALYEEG